MKKYEGNTIRQGKTATGKIPDSVGFPRSMSGGYGTAHRPLTKAEEKAQRKAGMFHAK